MIYYEDLCNINKISYNNGNKTVKDAVSHFGIEITTVNNYGTAITELIKPENGKFPYYACWVINSGNIENKAKQFLEILIKFWRNGGAVVLFSDNYYDGQKEIFGDETGLLSRPGLFNRKKNLYKYNNIQRQALSHNLYKIYEGITISSITKNYKRKMDFKQNDIESFIAFARNIEGGITSLLYLVNDNGEGDLILDRGFTKLFINMEENGIFRYIQNIPGFTARPKVHISNNINPKDYRSEKISLYPYDNQKK